MKAHLVATVLLCICSVSLFAQEAVHSKLQRFQYWDKLDKSDKFIFFLGFTNALGASGVTVLQCKDVTCAEMTPAKREQLRCILLGDDPDSVQAIAMIDKYYRENPEKWSEPIGKAMIDALTVNGGPCGVKATKK